MAKNDETTTEGNSTTATATDLKGDNAPLAALEREIDEAIGKVNAQDEPEEDVAEDSDEGVVTDSEEKPVEDAEDSATDEAPEGEVESEGPQGRDDKGQFTRKAPFSDALLERAVRAGIPIGEARQYQTEALLSSMVSRLEGFQKGAPGEASPAGAKGKEGEAQPAESDLEAALDAIPEEWSKEEYDERIVDALLSLKRIAKAQQKALAEVRGKESKDFFAKQLESVKDFTKGDQSKVTAIRAKFDLLKAGAKASGQDVSDVELFNDAAQLVLGGDMKAEAKKNKAEAAGRRSEQRISRAAGQRVSAKADPIAQTIDEINQRFFS